MTKFLISKTLFKKLECLGHLNIYTLDFLRLPAGRQGFRYSNFEFLD
jgi:hypothetical protein